VDHDGATGEETAFTKAFDDAFVRDDSVDGAVANPTSDFANRTETGDGTNRETVIDRHNDARAALLESLKSDFLAAK